MGIDIDALVHAAGLAPSTPLTLAWIAGDAAADHAAGFWPDGTAVRRTDPFYAASLTKQLTGAAVALLVKAGKLDPDTPIPPHVLPRWTERPTARQLLHHTGGLPVETFPESGRWTNRSVIAAIRGLSPPAAPPGTAYSYSNFGYIILARLVEAAAGMTFGQFVEARLLRPLGIDGARIHDDADPPLSPQVPLLGPVVPIWTGDGGLWTTAAAFAAWLDAQNHDALGIADLVTAPGRLSDGSATDYGWGIGLRKFRGAPLFIHGGSWRGAVAKAVRCPSLGLAVVGMAAATDSVQLGAVVDSMLEGLASA